MSSIYAKRDFLYLRVRLGGKWRAFSTGFKVGQEKQARALLQHFDEAQVPASREIVTAARAEIPIHAERWDDNAWYATNLVIDADDTNDTGFSVQLRVMSGVAEIACLRLTSIEAAQLLTRIGDRLAGR